MNAPTPNLPAERKPQLVAGAPVAALVPQTLEEAFRLSGALAASGMAPKGIDRPEQIMVAILAGAELGLAPFQSLQSFAIVNGRPTLYGDGLMAVARQHGAHVKEWREGDGDDAVAHCEVTRPDGEVIARTFTVAQAKKAGLWGKTGPWTQYPERMLQMRARAWALRDGCADMLRGIQVREEVEDFTHVRDVSPRPSGLAARLSGPSGEGFTSAQAEHADPVDFVEQAEEIAEAEFEAPAEDPPSDAEAADPDPEPFDAPAWAADVNRSLDDDERFGSVALLNAFTDDLANIAKFEALQKASPGLAKSLEAAINGRRKALTDRERD
jgi:hypothetical protein